MRNRQTMKQAGALLLSLAIIGGTVFPAGQIRAAAETKQPENGMKAATVSDAEKIPGTTVPGLLSRRPETMGKKRSSGGEVYVSASSSNARWDSGAGTEEDPYISLAYAVDQAEDGDTICLMSDLTETKSARFWDKDLTIDGQGHTVFRGDGFEKAQDLARGGYHPAMIEVGGTRPGEAQTASLTLTDIVLDDGGKTEGVNFKQASTDGKGGNESLVQDAIVATYNGTAEIILASGATLRNFGGMSAVRLSGGDLVMEDGSQICDDTDGVADRTKEKGDYGAAGAVWIQGGSFRMEAGAEISHMRGRAVYLDGGSAEIGGSISDIRSDKDMWQGGAGAAVHVRNEGTAVLSQSGSIKGIAGESAEHTVIDTASGDFEAVSGSEISGCRDIMVASANDYENDYVHKMLLNGLISDCTTKDSLMRSWYAEITVGPTGQVTGCTATGEGGLLYTHNGSRYVFEGKITGNTALKGIVYLANQGGGRVSARMLEGAEISNNKGLGIKVNNGALLTMEGGKISGNTGAGIEVKGKTEKKGAAFIMNGGEISGNGSYGISYANAGESVVELNGGTVFGNGSRAQISVTGGSSNDKNEFIHIKPGTLAGNREIYLSAGTMTLDEDYQEVWLGKAKQDAVDKIKELLAVCQPSWKLAGTTSLWIRPSSEDYHFLISRPYSADTSGLYAVYIPLNADGLPAADLTAEDMKLIPVENQKTLDVTMEGAEGNRSYALMFVNNDQYTLYPDQCGIYSGNAMPEPEDFSIGGLNKITSISVDGKETVYKTYGNEKEKAWSDLKALFTVHYVKADGSPMDGAETPGAYRAVFQYADPDLDGKVRINKNEVKLKDGVLVIRYTSSPAEELSSPLLSGEPAELPDQAVAVEQKKNGTRDAAYYLNGDQDRELSDTSGIVLLEDRPYVTGAPDGEEQLEERIEEHLGTVSGMEYHFEFRYLDLVDQNSANAWVTSNTEKLVYLQYPEGTDKNTEFTLLRFPELNREYGMNGHPGLRTSIATTGMETIPDLENTDQGIQFPASEFGLFAVVWGVPQNTVTIRYLDESTGRPIAGDSVRSFASGTEYDVTQDAGMEISGYTLSRIDGSVTGTITEDLVICVYYTKDQEPAAPSDPAEPTDPTDPTDPADPTDPSGSETPEHPEKETAQVVFRVVNGTFTENGGTEILKTYEVGSIIDSVPAVRADRGYRSRRWDRDPIGRTVEPGGMTFVLTFYAESVSGDDDDEEDTGRSRQRAVSDTGKTGRWILEGREFTENNGRLPSNEYLKIGGSIYGFYTHGIAIGFDHTERYTEEAIAAGGGYRDAEGTWRLNGWWFCYDDGTYPHGEWEYLAYNGRGDWYYFDEDGWMEDGWLFWNNSWYYLHTGYDGFRGHMYTGWHEIGGSWYYFRTGTDGGPAGAMLESAVTPDGFQVGADGAWIQ